MILRIRNGLCGVLAVLASSMWIGCGGSDSTATPGDFNRTSAGDPIQVPPPHHIEDRADAAGQTASSIRAAKTPDEIVRQFLTCLKTGDQSGSTGLLTARAQQEMSRSKAMIQPPGSRTAEFSVTQVELIGDHQVDAHVLSSWTDAESDGATATHDIVWILRRESTGWAISGFATCVFEDQPPVILDFENPNELEQTRAAVDAEIARRGSPASQNQSEDLRQAERPASRRQQ